MSNQEEWDDVLGTGSVLKRTIVPGDHDEDLDAEAPRKFFALIDIETRCQDTIVPSETHKNLLVNSVSDIYPGAHLVIPIMKINETSQYKFDARFGFGSRGLEPAVPANVGLECVITLKLRAHYDEFLEQMSTSERLGLARQKKDRGKFWYDRGDYENAVGIYKTLVDLCDADARDQDVN